MGLTAHAPQLHSFVLCKIFYMEQISQTKFYPKKITLIDTIYIGILL